MANPQFEITITVDTNDADYATLVSKISEVDLKLITPLIEAIKKFKPYQSDVKHGLSDMKWNHHHNFPFGECCRVDLGEKTARELYDFPEEVHSLFEEYLPMGNEYGFHTIESIEVTPFVKKTKLL